jgi:hypothetical protein
MPSAAEFRLAATRFDEVADDIADVGRACDRSGAREAFEGRSSVATSVDLALEAIDSSATSAVSACAHLAAECRRRAEECEAFEAAFREYSAANSRWWAQRSRWLLAERDGTPANIVDSLHPGTQPRRPTPPPFYDGPNGTG